jgi:hypothetical protein
VTRDPPNMEDSNHVASKYKTQILISIT